MQPVSCSPSGLIRRPIDLFMVASSPGSSVRQLMPTMPIFVSSPSCLAPPATPPQVLQHLSTLQPTPPTSIASLTSRVTTLERRDDKSLIESALDNTEQIVANLLANKKQNVVLKERAPCYVVLWYPKCWNFQKLETRKFYT